MRGRSGIARAVEDVRALSADGEGACVATCVALALAVLFGVSVLEANAAVRSSLADAPGGATFANARASIRSLYGARAAVVSGTLARMLELNGSAGLVVLGVNPRALYTGTAPGRHAILLLSCSRARMPRWATGLLEPVLARPSNVEFVDPARAISPIASVRSTVLAAAFDGAGREALLVRDPSTQAVPATQPRDT